LSRARLIGETGPCLGGWTETPPVLRPSRKGRALRIGEQLLTADVLLNPDVKEFVPLLVRGCEILSEIPGKMLPPIRTGTEMKRA
jgi:hypothetical protein